MTAEIIHLDHYREEHHAGNGGREAMTAALDQVMPMGGALVDDVLSDLWLLGFKVVPVADEDV